MSHLPTILDYDCGTPRDTAPTVLGGPSTNIAGCLLRCTHIADTSAALGPLRQPAAMRDGASPTRLCRPIWAEDLAGFGQAPCQRSRPPHWLDLFQSRRPRRIRRGGNRTVC